MEISILVLIVAVVAGGVLGGVLRGWSLLATQYALSERVSLLEGSLLREVKSRAAKERWSRTAQDVAGIDDAVLAAAAKKPEPPLQQWWTNPQGRPRAYP